MRGLAKLHGRTLQETFRATLWSYLKLTRDDQRRAMNLEPALPVHEIKAWGGVQSDGHLCPWAAPSYDIVNDPNEVVRVIVRHLPAEADQRPRGWKE